MKPPYSYSYLVRIHRVGVAPYDWKTLSDNRMGVYRSVKILAEMELTPGFPAITHLEVYRLGIRQYVIRHRG